MPTRHASPHISALLALIDRYQHLAGVAEGKVIPDTTVGVRLFNHANKVGMLRSGADITSARISVAAARLRDIWPNDDVPTADFEALTLTVDDKHLTGRVGEAMTGGEVS